MVFSHRSFVDKQKSQDIQSSDLHRINCQNESVCSNFSFPDVHPRVDSKPQEDSGDRLKATPTT